MRCYVCLDFWPAHQAALGWLAWTFNTLDLDL